MSGDVQPRKRKEKRKKKEGGSLGTIHDQVSFQKFSKDFDEKKHVDLSDQGEKIHVQSEHGIGGNICVKIIFFCLLGLLVGAIGLIYQQYQGSTDVDLPSIEESRFAEYFTGWLDDGADDHEHESIENMLHEESSEHDEDKEMEEHAEEEEDEEEEEEEHNENEDEENGDENEKQSHEQDEPDIFSRLLGIQKNVENENENEEESVDEKFVKSEVDEANEDIPDSEIEQQRVSEVEKTPPTPPPRTHKRGPQTVDEEAEENIEFLRNENRDEEILKNSEPPHESMPSEKQTESDDDWYFKEELSYADQHFENNPKASLTAYNKILSKKATSVRALIGRARVLDHLAEKERSNAYLKQATNAYKTLLLDHGNLLQDDIYLKLAERCIERMRFGGYLGSAIEVHKAMIFRFPNTPKYRNTLAVTYLMLNKIELARKVLNETLTLWPGNGFALVHYGFILKTNDNNMEEAVKKLTTGIETKEEGVIEGMFFFHLGDALNRLGRPQEAMKWYDLGVKEGLFLSKYQRSLYNVNRLKGQPWWTKEETTYQSFFKRLEDNWREIQREGLALLNSKGVNLFKEETENLKDTGDWRQLDLYFRGRQQSNCKLAPVTCSLVSSFKPAAGCTRGQIKFSVMLPDTHVWPHCGPTNCRLRSHLGLIVPKFTYIRVAEETRSWEEGKFIIFDDSFEHEVWHNGTGPRLVLIVDVWHPELTQQERQSLSPI